MRVSPLAPACLALATLALVSGHAAPDASAFGKPIYDRLCGGCHQIGIGAANGVGPQLNGILGMPAADQAGYEYSPAAKSSAVVWTDAAFLAFIADPAAAMPGTRMQGPKVASDTERQAILAYIARFRSDGTLR